MKFLFDLFPIIVFFIAYKISGIFAATALAILGTFAQVAWSWWRHRHVDTMLWISLIIISIFGGSTLVLHDENFIKWKPSILYGLFAAALFVSKRCKKINLMQKLLSAQLDLPDSAWDKLNRAWIYFFLLMATSNLVVAFNFSTETWVNFKLFGSLGLMLGFVVLQAALLAKYLEEKK